MSEEKKKDALADALAALAAGEHPEEPHGGSGIDAHAQPVGEAPIPTPTKNRCVLLLHDLHRLCRATVGPAAAAGPPGPSRLA